MPESKHTPTLLKDLSCLEEFLPYSLDTGVMPELPRALEEGRSADMGRFDSGSRSLTMTVMFQLNRHAACGTGCAEDGTESADGAAHLRFSLSAIVSQRCRNS
jgi:hypothetical protein